MIGDQHRGTGIERTDALRQIGSVDCSQIQLGQHNAVGNCDLLARNLLALKRSCAIYGIDGGDNATEDDAARARRVGHQCLQNWRGVGEPAGLDNNAIERRTAALITTVKQVLERSREVTADLAAEAAGLQFDETVFAGLDQLVVKPDLAKFIDDDGGSGEVRLAKQMPQYGSLAAAKEAGEDRNRNPLGSH